MSKFYVLFLVGLVVWQVISAIIQASAKKQEQERRAQAARQHRLAQGGQVGQPQPTSLAQETHPDPGPPSVPQTGAGARVGPQSIADRRRAQLEELRARRQNRDTRVQTGSTSGRTSAPPTRTPGPASSKPAIQTLEAGLQNLHEHDQAERRRREAQARQRGELTRQTAQRQAAQERLAQQQQQETARQSKRASRQRTARSGIEPADPTTPNPYGTRQGRTPQVDAIRGAMGRAETLRQLFVMKELLDPPVGERPPE